MPPDRAAISVAAIIDTAIVSGPGRQLAAVVPPLRQLGVEVLPVLFHRHPRPSSLYSEYLRARAIPHITIEESGRGDARVINRLDDVLRERRPDIVQTHSYRPTTLAWILRRWRRRPWHWVGFFHGLTSENLSVRLYHRLDRRLLAAADQVLVVARPQLDLFPHCRGRVQVIDNAMLPEDSPDPAGDAAVHERLCTLQRPLISVVGRLSSEKGVDLFIRAFARLCREGVEGTAVVAGDGPERRSLEALAADLRVMDRIVFLGHLPSARMVHTESDLVVLPSRSEGMPNSLLEAMAAGKPVVATDVGAVPDILGLAGADVGSLVRRGSVEALASAMRFELGRQPAPRVESARERVRDRYSLSHRAAVLREVYDRVLAAGASSREQ